MEIRCYIKTPKHFSFYQQKPKSIAPICCRLSVQCTKTVYVHECLWPQMDCNLKKARLTVFKFSRFRFLNALEQVMSCSFQEFIRFLFLDVLELFLTKGPLIWRKVVPGKRVTLPA